MVNQHASDGVVVSYTQIIRAICPHCCSHGKYHGDYLVHVDIF